MRKTLGEKIGLAINGFLLLLLAFIAIYPFWHVLMYSLSNSQAASSGGLFFWPRNFDLLGYKLVLQQPQIYRAYWNTISERFSAPRWGLSSRLLWPIRFPFPVLKGAGSFVWLFSLRCSSTRR